MRRRRRGFSLLELMIGLLLLSLLFWGLNRLLGSGQREMVHGQETIDHLWAETVLFRTLENDMLGMIPIPINTGTARAGGPVNFSPSNAKAGEILFWRMSARKLQQVRYLFDAGRKEVRREEVDRAGQCLVAQRFGTGMVSDFSLADPSGEGKLVKATLVMRGKLRATASIRFFARGIADRQALSSWLFAPDVAQP